ncbi:Variant Surface Glycoprotein [Trypanosoma brucei equiperdum]|uniref:Variant Surface Glycoprotein n=1 Tax=Trypanosoma brucei equiperdum TaxID=630700 RepID=A0A3L6KVS9_9TRYP|nr:Variant Surface Glycoprotein [Trypanosoma brucei equiperdum]
MPTAVFDGWAAGDRQSNCAGDGNSKKATTFLATFVCVCAKDTANTADGSKACTGTALTQDWTGANANPSERLVLELVQLCNRHHTTKLTAADLRWRINLVTELITYESAAYFGTHIKGQCNGSANAGICVKYTTLARAAKAPTEAILWLKDLSDLAAKLEDHEAATLKLKRINEAIQTKAKAAAHLAHMAKQAAKTELDPTTTGQSKPAVAKEDCSNHKDNATCKEKGCKWEENSSDKSKGTCKHEGGEGQTNTAGGTGAGGASDTEAKSAPIRKKQEDCKDGCKWDGKECKDSYILVNKKFNLSISAAFMSFVAF